MSKPESSSETREPRPIRDHSPPEEGYCLYCGYSLDNNLECRKCPSGRSFADKADALKDEMKERGEW